MTDDEKRREDEVRCALFKDGWVATLSDDAWTVQDVEHHVEMAMDRIRERGLLDAMHRVAVGPRADSVPAQPRSCAHERTWPVRWHRGFRMGLCDGFVCRDCAAEDVSGTGAWCPHERCSICEGEHIEPFAPHPLALAWERHEERERLCSNLDATLKERDAACIACHGHQMMDMNHGDNVACELCGNNPSDSWGP